MEDKEKTVFIFMSKNIFVKLVSVGIDKKYTLANCNFTKLQTCLQQQSLVEELFHFHCNPIVFTDLENKLF